MVDKDYVYLLVATAITGLFVTLVTPSRMEQWGYTPLITELEPYYFFPLLAMPLSILFFLFWVRDKRASVKH